MLLVVLSGYYWCCVMDLLYSIYFMSFDAMCKISLWERDNIFFIFILFIYFI